MQVILVVLRFIGVEAGNFCVCKAYFVLKILCHKCSPFKFSVAVGTLYFLVQSWRGLENRKFGTWNLLLNYPTEKSTLSRAKTLSEASPLSIREHLPHSFEFFHSHSSCCCQRGTSDLAEVGLELLPYLKTYMWNVSYCLYYDFAASLTKLSVQLHMYAICNRQYGKMCSSKHYNQNKCPVACSIPTVYNKTRKLVEIVCSYYIAYI